MSADRNVKTCLKEAAAVPGRGVPALVDKSGGRGVEKGGRERGWLAKSAVRSCQKGENRSAMFQPCMAAAVGRRMHLRNVRAQCPRTGRYRGILVSR